MKYRSDLDGLRGIAILLVLIFHISPQGLPGGYIGVDIFFVLSGFLISNIVIQKLRNEDFSFKEFYLVRIRRLLPAQLVTTISCLFLGKVLLDNKNFIDLTKSAIYSTFAAANIHFFKLGGYFDHSSFFKPLEHYWSLAVEEQFYLFWPLLLLFFHKRNFIKIKPLSIFIFFTLVFSQFGVYYNQNAAFFLTPFRAFEFALGFLCTLIIEDKKIKIDNEAFKFILFILSVLGIVIPSILFSGETSFPGVTALIPCMASVLLISFFNNYYLNKIYNNRPLIFFGKISYSMYLVHYPIIIFYELYSIGHSSFYTMTSLFVITIVLGYILNICVEQKFRYKPATKQIPLKNFSLRVAFLVTILVTWSVIEIKNPSPDNWKSNIFSGLKATKGFVGKKEASTWGLGECYIGPHYIKGDKFSQKKINNCLKIKENKINIMLIGDSVAGSLTPGFKRYFEKNKKINLSFLTHENCSFLRHYQKENQKMNSESCKSYIDYLIKTWIPDNHKKIDKIFLSMRWFEFSNPKKTKILANALSPFRDKIIILGPTPLLDYSISSMLDSFILKERFSKILSLEIPRREDQSNALNETIQTKYNKKMFDVDIKMSDYFKENGFKYISIMEKHCPNKICINFVKQDIMYPIISDKHHYSPEGSVFITKLILDDKLLVHKKL